MILIIHNKEYIVNDEIDDIQVLLDEGVISQEQADLYFEMVVLESRLGAVVEVKHDREQQQEKE